MRTLFASAILASLGSTVNLKAAQNEAASGVDSILGDLKNHFENPPYFV